MWNFRKEAVLAELDRIGDAAAGVSNGEGGGKAVEGNGSSEGQGVLLRGVYEEELTLSVDCIKRNPKSYPAWHHHKWALERGLTLLGGRWVRRQEISLLFPSHCKVYGRNFHCWAHRMWVAEQMGLSAQEEFDFTTDKIKQNFSNYSAFHFRSKVLPRMVAEAGHDRWQLLSDELELTHDAMFTEPADQSVWWYHHFLLTWAEESVTSVDAERYENFLRAEAATLEELIEVEDRCKWAELALLLVSQRLANALDRRAEAPVEEPVERSGVGGDEEARKVRERCRGMAARLSDLDPMHGQFYEFVARGEAVFGGAAAGGPADETKEG
ncbi:unnamed protein product [Scytosiphon promiscuus]